MPQFIGYHVNENGQEAIPVSTGPDYQTCLSLAITRTMSLGTSDGSLQVQQRDDVSPEDYEKLTAALDAAAAVMGVAS